MFVGATMAIYRCWWTEYFIYLPSTTAAAPACVRVAKDERKSLTAGAAFHITKGVNTHTAAWTQLLLFIRKLPIVESWTKLPVYTLTKCVLFFKQGLFSMYRWKW